MMRLSQIDWRALGFLFLVALLVHFPPALSWPLIDRDEPRFARATVEMINNHEWNVPSFNGKPRYDKPVLPYWLMRVGVYFWGENEIAFRVHSILFLTLTAFIIFKWLDGKWAGSRGAWIAALGWIFTFQNLVHGHLALADMPMIFAVAWTMILWKKELNPNLQQLHAVTVNADWKKSLLWSIPLALGFLSKGPIAWGVPLLSLLLTRYLFVRRTVHFPLKTLGVSFLIALFWIACWGVPALLQTGGDFWKVGIQYHVIERGTASFNHRTYLPFFYAITIWVSLFPFSAALIPTLKSAFRSRLVEESFLLSWLLSSIVIFSFYSTQLPHYILPSFPAFFILFGKLLDRSSLDQLTQTWSVKIQFALSLAVVGLFLYGGHRVQDLRPFNGMTPVFYLPALLILAGMGAYWGMLAQKNLRVLVALVLCVALIYGGVLWGAGVVLRENHPVVRLLDRYGALQEGEMAQATGFQEPSLNFYLKGRWSFEENREVSPHLRIRQVSEQKLFPLLFGKTDALEKRQPPTHFDIEGFNPARFSWIQLEVTREK